MYGEWVFSSFALKWASFSSSGPPFLVEKEFICPLIIIGCPR